MANTIPFFVLNEDESQTDRLKKLVNKVFPNSPVYASDDGLYAVKFLTKNNTPTVVLSSLNVKGINGVQVLKKIRSEHVLQKMYFILTVDQKDTELPLKALQSGADDFIKTPIKVDQFLSKMRSAVRFISERDLKEREEARVMTLERELIESSDKMYKIVEKFQAAQIEDAPKMLDRVKKATIWIAEQMKELDNKQKEDILKAAGVALVGKLFLPENLIKAPVFKKGDLTNQKMLEIPEHAMEILEGIKGYEEVAKIVYHIYENFDGSGFPKKHKSADIPFGSRVIRTVLDYEEFRSFGNYSYGKAMETLLHEARRFYEFKTVAFLDQYFAYLNSRGERPTEKPIHKNKLEQRMVLSRNIYTESEMNIMAAFTTLTDEKIMKIQDILSADKVIGEIYVKK